MGLLDRIGKKHLFFDGAMGTLLQERGLKPGELPENMNLRAPDVIAGIHREYVEAGCDIIIANTFGANRVKLEGAGLDVQTVVAAAINNCKAAIKTAKTTKEHYIALDMSSTGKLLEPFGELSFEEAVDIYKEQAMCGEANGADLCIIETMTDTYEMKAAVIAVKENTNLPVFATFSFDERERLLTGGDIICTAALLEGLGVDALGINCSFGPKKMKGLLTRLAEFSSLPIIFMPNAGMPVFRDGKTVFELSPEEFAQEMAQTAAVKAQILGGCCGTTPAHLKKTIELCADITPPPVTEKDITAVTSYSKSCIIGEKPVIIGERINPTGKKKFKEALLNGDFDYIVEQGVEQQEAGADILDVNVGIPGIDEREVLLRAVKELQTSVTLPLQIDSGDPQAMEKSVRAYNGKPMINSVSGKEESMRRIFPIAKKYGGVVVALTLDENGIPQTAEERLQIARNILAVAEEYGINRKNIIVDTLTMTVGASPDAAKVTLDALELVQKELGVKTVLGVSNVSFGLPQRDVINATFFAEALCHGLDAGIINPLSDAMMNTYYSHNALSAHDPLCLDYGNYIQSLTQTKAQTRPEETQTPLFAAIKGGISQKTFDLTKEELEDKNPQRIVDEILVPALDEVGKGFEKGTLFLPQLIKSAEAAQNAFVAIKEELLKSGAEQKIKGRVLLATVEGDIHDIGKNIVKVMLENYGFEVLDLGRDVSSEKILDTVKKESIELVGLSALMTTTAPAMEKTIRLLRSNNIKSRVMVGGAVITEEYAKQIGADFYAPDAMAGVAAAEEVFG